MVKNSEICKGKKRIAGLELMRLVMMFGIVMIHAVGHCAYPRTNVGPFLDWCVCGFVFLSGWFGIRFSAIKCFKLVMLGAWCALLPNISRGWPNAIKDIFGYWFLWAYIILMMLSPIIDAALKSSNRRNKVRLALPVLFIVYVWLVLCAIPVVRDWIPHPKGLDGCSFFPLVGIYVMVQLYKEFNWGRLCTARNALITLPLCVLMMTVGFWWHWWIPAFVVTCFSFEFFRHLRLPAAIERFVLFLAPSAFSIYLLHLTAGGLKLMSRLEVFFAEDLNLGIWTGYLFASSTIFLACLAVDLLRRLFLWVVIVKLG